MLCRNCQYPLARLTTSRCPECGCAFDPSDASTYHTARPAWPRSIAARAALAIAFFGSWGLTTMWRATDNTSWEQHPFAGPFIIIKESLQEQHTAADWALALLFWAFFFAFPVCWIISGRIWAAIVTLALCLFAIAASHFAAMTASC